MDAFPSAISELRPLKYQALIDFLRAEISRGALKPGDKVPSLVEMRSRFGVSRATVDKAFDLLEQEGVLSREQGRGTFVSLGASVTASPQELAPDSSSTTIPSPARHWVPNKAGSAPGESRSAQGMIGLLILTRNPYHPYILHLMAGIREEARQMGVRVLWLEKGEPIPWDQLDGILMYLGNEEPSLEFPEGMPAVSVLRHRKGYTNVTADDFGGSEMATRYLLQMGHQRIACLFSSPEDIFSQQRLAGYRSALSKAGVPFRPEYVRYVYDYLTGNYLLNGETHMRAWLETDWSQLGCTAILAANDDAAIGIIKVLGEKGVRIPEDVSVIGFDGLEVSEYSIPRLTTVQVPLKEIGAQGMRLLWHHIQSGQRQNTSHSHPTRLKLGDSTSVPRSSPTELPTEKESPVT